MTWTNNLNNEQLKTLSIQASSDNLFEYQEILSILQAAASGGISDSEYADLQSIYTNAVDSFSNDYLATITYNVIYSNPSNETWWGGVTSASSAQPLGNMSAGMTEQKASWLVDKWFLGLDLPMPVAGGDTATGKASTGSYSYTLSDGEVFIDGALASDISQGATGDCYFLASAGAVAAVSSSLIENAFIDNGNGTYGVRFYLNGEAVYTTVNEEIPVQSGWWGERAVFGSNQAHDIDGEMWVSLLEKAYMQLNTQADINNAGGQWQGENSYQALEGGLANPISQLTNADYTYYSSYYGGLYDQYDSGLHHSFSSSTYKQTIVDALENGAVGWLGSWGNTYSGSKKELVAGHAFMILGYDSNTDLFTLRNPWGNGGSSYVGEFEVTIDEFWNSSVKGLVAISDPISLEPDPEPEPEVEINYTLSSDAGTMATAADEGEAITFTVTRDTTGSVSTVYLTTATGLEISSADQADFNGFDKLAVQFDSHETSKLITVYTFIDNLDEATEDFQLQLFKESTDLTVDTSTTAYIANVEAADYSYTITTEADSSETGVSEGHEIAFTISRNASGTASTVYLSTEDITARAGFDYIGLDHFALNFAAYETEKTLYIGSYHDSASEGDENFTLNLYENLSDGIVSATANAYIKDEYLPYYSYSVQSDAGSPDTAVEEGGTVTFTITRSGSGTEATVFVATQGGSAGNNDYDHVELQAVTFAADQKVVTLEVQTNEDWWLESDEYFKLNVFKNATDSSPAAYGAAFIADKVYSDYNYSIENDATVQEGGTITFTITRDGSGSASTVYLTTDGGTASSGDYEQLDQFALEFSEYETSKTVTLNVFEDFDDESAENFWLNLYHNKSDAGYSAQSEVTIENVAPQTDYNYTISDNSSLLSPTQEGGSVTFTITRDGSGSASTVYLSTTHGTANASDYAALDKQALTFASYETSKTITVDIYQDGIDETLEFFWLDLFKSYDLAEKGRYDTYAGAFIESVNGGDTDSYDYTINTTAGYATPATEGGEITLTVTRSGSGSESTVYVKTHEGTAQDGSDFNGISTQAVTFADYETIKTITIDTYQDSNSEYPEYFWASVYNGDPSAPGAGTALDSTVNYIQDAPETSYGYSISSFDRKVDEGEGITYTITRDGSGHASTVYLNTQDAGASGNADYAGLNGYELNFASYETSKTITINTYEDDREEYVEGFWIQLFTNYADIADNNYIAYDWGLIEDATDASAPGYNYTLSSDTTDSDPALEGDSLTFTVTRNSSGTASTIYLQTSDSTATAGPDYEAVEALAVSFAEYETSKTITLDSYQDADLEGVESFGLELYKNQADLQSGNLHAWTNGYIDDQPIKQYNYTINSNNSPVTEGDALSFTITRDGSGSAATVYLSTNSGTATQGSDFEQLDSYSVKFADYETSKTITLDTYQDSNDEGEEYFFLNLFTSISDELSGDYAAFSTGRIEDPEEVNPGPNPDPEPEFSYTISPEEATVDEGDSFTFTITRSHTGSATTVYLKTNDSTTNGSLDYAAFALQQVNFSDYETSKTITIETYVDNAQEDDESFGLELYKSAGDLLSGDMHAWATAHINDTSESLVDYSYTLESDNSPVMEGEALSFTITRSGSDTESSVFLSTTNGTAQANSDFSAVSAEEISFAIGETSKTFTIETFEDNQTEGNEVFWLDLYKTYADAQNNIIDSYVLATIADKVVDIDFNYTISSDITIDNPAGEGNSISFTITRDNSGAESTVYLSTSDSTTLSNLDYAALSGYELSFGASETSKTITIDTYQDNLSEGTEYFSLELYESQAELQQRDYHAWHTAAIEDTVTEDFSYTLTSLNSPVEEGDALIFEVTRNGSGSESTVYINTSDDTATEGEDYTGLSLQAVEFGENETSKMITISTTTDAETEGDEFFWVDLFKTQADAQNGTFEAYSWGMIQDKNDTSSVQPEAAETQSSIATRSFSQQAPQTGAQADSSMVASYPGHSQGMFNNNGAFAAIKVDGTVVTWGNSNSGGDSSSVADDLTGVQQIATSSEAFAALKSDGSVVTWGNSNLGGNSSTVASSLDGSIAVTALYSSEAAFAALREDGSVITWGANGAGANSSSIATELNGTTDVTSISSNMSAFAAVRSDGSVVTWGFDSFGGDSSAIASELDGSVAVTQVFSTGSAFAALREDGSVVTWGSSNDGGDSSAVASQLDSSNDVAAIYATTSAFAALRSDGTVVTWGDINNGGNSDAVASQLTGVTSLLSTNTAFAALLNDGSVVTWGANEAGGDSSAVTSELNGSSNVTQLYANESAFAALLSDGSVVSWGSDTAGGNSSSVSSELNGDIDVINIVASNNAFAAIRSDGSVITWGNTLGGGDSSSVADQLDGSTAITNIYSTGFAFAALREDGSVVTWGDFEYGGNSSAVSDDLNNIVGVSSTDSSDRPDVTEPDTITYTDTAADDSFSVKTGTITASGDDLVFKFSDGSQSQTGNYGVITLDNSTGAWSYTPDDAAIEGLKETTSESFTVVISNGQSNSNTTLTVELQGSDDSTEFAGDTAGNASEQSTTTSGTITVDDRDSADDVTITASTASSNYGSFSIDTSGQWSYTLDAESSSVQDLDTGQNVDDSFTVTASDGSAQTVTITVAGQDSGEGASGGQYDISANEGDSVINGSVTGADGVTYSAADGQTDIAGFQLNSDGSYSFDPDDSHYSSMTEGEVLELSFNYQASDSSSGIFNITMTGKNTPPVINKAPENLSVASNSIFSYSFLPDYFQDPDQTEDLSYSVTLTDGSSLPDWLLFDENYLTFSGVPPVDSAGQTVEVRLTATDLLNASTSSDFSIYIASADERLSNSEDNDVFYGSDNNDTVELSYLPGLYDLQSDALSGPEGNDILINIDNFLIGSDYAEIYQVSVSKEDLIASSDNAGKSLVDSTIDNVADLYLAYFGRAPDAEGLTYWFKEIYTESLSFAAVAQSFSLSDEYNELYPAGTSNHDFISTVYQNMFDRSPDQAGLDYWIEQLDNGMSKDTFLLSVINGAYASTGSSEDSNLLTNKHDVSVYYAEQSDLHRGVSFDDGVNALLSLVTSESDTVNSARNVIDYAFTNDMTLDGIISNTALLDQIWS